MRKLVLAAASAAALSLACSALTPAPRSQQVVVLGVDGMDPDLARAWMREGRLPNLAALANRGSFNALQTLPAPQCDAAWLSLAAGAAVPNPVVSHQPAELLLNFVPLTGESWTTTRTSDAFWSIAGHAGVRSSVLTVPGTSPPPASLPNGELLAGSPLPDIRRSAGAYQFLATTIADEEAGVTGNGGLLQRLQFTNRVAHASIRGPLHPVSRDELSAPLQITWNHEARSVNVQLGGHAVHLREREWSRWLEVDFDVNAITRVHGLVQLFLVRAGTELELYVSPVHWHPNQPPAAISTPPAFARELYERLGPFRTWGWNAPTAALADERIDEAAFLDDLDRAFQDRAETILNRLDVGEWDLLVGVVEAPDRVQHMMWRLRDTQHPRYDSELARRYSASIEQAYQQADELLGQIVSRVSPQTLVLVVSDHGFHTVRSPSKWSGDHTSKDAGEVAGVVVSSVPLTNASPHLFDIAPTVLKYLGVAAPSSMRGRPLF